MSTQVQDRQQSAQLAGLIRRQSTRCYKAIERRVSRRSATHTSTSRQSKALASDTHATFEVYRVELPEWIGRRKANPIHVSQHEGSIDSDDRQPETNEILSTTCSGSIELSTDSQHIGTEESDSPTRTQVDDTSSLPLAYDPQPVEGYTRAQLIDMPPHTPPTSAAYAWPDHPLLTMTRNYRELLRTHYKSQFEMELAYTVKGEAWPDYGACPERWQCNPHEFLLAHNMVYAHHYELDRVLQRQEDLIVTWAPHSLPFGGGGKVTEETAAEAYVHNGSLSCIQIINEADGRDYLIFRAERCKMMLAERRRRAVLAGHTVAPFGPCECKECKEMAERKKRMIEEMLDREEQAEKDARRCAPMAL
ncbi:hypothetical protein B0A48_10449 [Cryoendolithus antarcticus]|uniref:Uncharacterized protein n=1 Tax=Cryoendolithus antarcticus TaxID=1507870 RepID=A0A1V8SXK9_9PEZI|nr:hypothetical protein B0A48_10449 [Cryoendolithus antarcticus]